MLPLDIFAGSSAWPPVSSPDPGELTLYKHPTRDLYSLSPVMDMSVDEFIARFQDMREEYDIEI